MPPLGHRWRSSTAISGGTTIQFTLRELLAALGFTAVGLAALRLGGVLASIVIAALALVLMAIAIVAIVGTGVSRIRAIGFLTPVAVYAMILLVAGRKEYDLYGACLPSSRVITALHKILIVQTYEPGTTLPRGYGGMGLGDPGSMYGEVTLENWTFMILGHCIIAVLLGFFGRRFAATLFHQQQNVNRDEPSDGPESPTDRF